MINNDDFDDAIRLAESNNINVAWSNESFELWILLHFQDLKMPIPRNQYIVNLNKHLNINKLGDGKYNKNISDIFDITVDKVEIAIKRSEKLRQYHETQRQDKESEMNPCTSVDILVKELLRYIK